MEPLQTFMGKSIRKYNKTTSFYTSEDTTTALTLLNQEDHTIMKQGLSVIPLIINVDCLLHIKLAILLRVYTARI